MYSLFNEGVEQLYSEEGALVKSPRERRSLLRRVLVDSFGTGTIKPE